MESPAQLCIYSSCIISARRLELFFFPSLPPSRFYCATLGNVQRAVGSSSFPPRLRRFLAPSRVPASPGAGNESRERRERLGNRSPTRLRVDGLEDGRGDESSVCTWILSVARVERVRVCGGWVEGGGGGCVGAPRKGGSQSANSPVGPPRRIYIHHHRAQNPQSTFHPRFGCTRYFFSVRAAAASVCCWLCWFFFFQLAPVGSVGIARSGRRVLADTRRIGCGALINECD